MNIEALAREAGLYVGTNMSGIKLVGAGKEGILLIHLTLEDLERFAHLIREAVLQELIGGSEYAEWLGYDPDRGDMYGYIADQLAGAVLRERERCARIVEADPSYDWHKFACECAAAIRSGK